MVLDIIVVMMEKWVLSACLEVNAVVMAFGMKLLRVANVRMVL